MLSLEIQQELSLKSFHLEARCASRVENLKGVLETSLTV